MSYVTDFGSENFGVADNVDWEAAERDLGVTILPLSIGCSLEDDSMYARLADGGLLRIWGETGEAEVLSPQEAQDLLSSWSAPHFP